MCGCSCINAYAHVHLCRGMCVFVCVRVCVACMWGGRLDVEGRQELAGDEAGQTSCSRRIQWHIPQGCFLSREAGDRKAVPEF